VALAGLMPAVRNAALAETSLVLLNALATKARPATAIHAGSAAVMTALETVVRHHPIQAGSLVDIVDILQIAVGGVPLTREFHVAIAA